MINYFYINIYNHILYMFKFIIPYMLPYSFIEKKQDVVTHLNNFNNYYIDYFIINHIIS